MEEREWRKKAAKGAAAKKKAHGFRQTGQAGQKEQSGDGYARRCRHCGVLHRLLALLCQFIPSDGGFLNRCMLVVRGLGGMLCLLLPVVLCWTGAVLVFSGRKSGAQER
ncbi:MAG: hypothetical protein ACLR4A_10705 [Christensenellales bacterium]